MSVIIDASNHTNLYHPKNWDDEDCPVCSWLHRQGVDPGDVMALMCYPPDPHCGFEGQTVAELFAATETLGKHRHVQDGVCRKVMLIEGCPIGG